MRRGATLAGAGATSGAATCAIKDMGHDNADLAPGGTRALPRHARDRERSRCGGHAVGRNATGGEGEPGEFAICERTPVASATVRRTEDRALGCVHEFDGDGIHGPAIAESARTMLAHIEHLARPQDADGLGKRIVEEMASLGCLLLKAAASLTESPRSDESGVFTRRESSSLAG